MLHEHEEGTKRRWLPRLFALGMVGVSLPAFQACADYSPAVEIVANLAAAPPQCMYTAKENPTYWSTGVMDLGLTTTYLAHLMFANSTVGNAQEDLQRVDTNGIFVDGAEVRVLAGDREIVSYTAEAGGFARSGTVNSQGLGIATLTLVPGTAEVHAALLSLLGPAHDIETLIYTETQLFGRTAAGSTFKTPVFTYPIRLCYGCLVVFPDGPKGSCPYVTGTYTTESCTPGQDSEIDCKACVGKKEVCGS